MRNAEAPRACKSLPSPNKIKQSPRALGKQDLVRLGSTARANGQWSLKNACMRSSGRPSANGRSDGRNWGELDSTDRFRKTTPCTVTTFAPLLFHGLLSGGGCAVMGRNQAKQWPPVQRIFGSLAAPRRLSEEKNKPSLKDGGVRFRRHKVIAAWGPAIRVFRRMGTRKAAPCDPQVTTVVRVGHGQSAQQHAAANRVPLVRQPATHASRLRASRLERYRPCVTTLRNPGQTVTPRANPPVYQPTAREQKALSKQVRRSEDEIPIRLSNLRMQVRDESTFTTR
jgi:hypothetical protein